MNNVDDIKKIFSKIKIQKPLILNLTNHVTMDFIANCLLAIGASPIMCMHANELDELISMASVVYINIGTLNDHFINLVKTTLKIAKNKQKSIVLDPVGAGSTKQRTKLSHEVANYAAIIRGNASEIIGLGYSYATIKGLDSMHKTEDALDVANALAVKNNNTIAISGQVDYITDKFQNKKLHFGSPIMTQVTGMGCSLTAVLAAVLAVVQNPFEASVIGTQYFSMCGELVSLKHKKPGSFKVAFIDELSDPSYDTMRELCD